MVKLGQINRLVLSELLLDPQNPRLPEDVQGGSQEELAVYISEAYEALSVATSVTEHGYFESEPLIAIPGDDGLFVVVEGNRRLTALRGITDAALRAKFDSPKAWHAAAAEAAHKGTTPHDVPVLVVPNRKVVAPIIGFRHISGIMQWEPFAKARFIAALVDDERLDFASVGDLVGEKKGDIASNYRNFSILRQARDEHGLDTERVEEAFGVFTAAMGQRALRTFIGAPDPGEVQAGVNPVPADKAAELDELLIWVFGDEDGQGRVIAESRDLGLLARVVTSTPGLASLRQQGDLKTAAEATSDSSADARRRVVSRLTVARSGLRAAAELLATLDGVDEEISALVEDCDQALGDVRSVAES